MDEAKFKVGDQWYYRGNRSSSWLFVASRADGTCQDGICEKVPVVLWPMLEEIARLRALQPEAARILDECEIMALARKARLFIRRRSSKCSYFGQGVFGRVRRK